MLRTRLLVRLALVCLKIIFFWGGVYAPISFLFDSVATTSLKAIFGFLVSLSKTISNF